MLTTQEKALPKTITRLYQDNLKTSTGQSQEKTTQHTYYTATQSQTQTQHTIAQQEEKRVTTQRGVKETQYNTAPPQT
jgi:hypothetical protein